MLNKPKILSIHNQYPTPVAKKYGLYGGVGYYRQIMPAKHMPKFTFIHAGKQLLDVTPETMEQTVGELVRNSDLVYTKHLDNPYAVYTLLGACDYYKKPLIVDFDDNVFTTDGLSPNGYVYPEGQARHYLETLLQSATAITVSSKSLVPVYEKYTKVHVLPNAVDMGDWTWAKRSHERFTVGWAGSASHAKDHSVLESVYPEVAERNPDVVFSFVGHMLPEHIQSVKGLKRKNWEIRPGISWWEGNPENNMTYPRLLAENGYDVGLAPLIESQFNASRSLAKWFEYTMTGIPTIASEWGPYLDLRDGQDAYLVKTQSGWVEAIDHLIKNKNDRERLVATARQRIIDEYSIAKIVPAWDKVFTSYLGAGFSV